MLPRVIQLPEALAGCRHGFVFLSSILHGFVGDLFAGMEVKGCYQFRVTRNSDLFVDEEEIKNLRTKIQGELLSAISATPFASRSRRTARRK